VEYNLSRSFGYLVLLGETRRPEAVYQKVRETVKNAEALLTEKDFIRSRRAVFSRSVQDWNSTTEIAENFMDFAFSGGDMLLYPETVKNVSFEDLKNRIRLSYRRDKLVLSVVKPGKEK